MNIYEKLQQARVELQGMNLKMGGINKFADFKYFELKDFLPEINNIFNKLKLFSKFDLLENEGVLTVINTEKTDEVITFVTPKAEIILKGQNGLQMIGSTHTYLKRYCYLNALEIVEDDVINATIDKDKAENKHQNEKKQTATKKQAKKELSEEEKRTKGIKYIVDNFESFSEAILKNFQVSDVFELEEIETEKIGRICKFIKTELQKKGA